MARLMIEGTLLKRAERNQGEFTPKNETKVIAFDNLKTTYVEENGSIGIIKLNYPKFNELNQGDKFLFEGDNELISKVIAGNSGVKLDFINLNMKKDDIDFEFKIIPKEET